MLSNKLNESVHTTEEKSSKQEKKKLDKNTLEEVEVESSTPSDTNSEGKNNKYINIINKKLRTLRKRMNKIKKYESCDEKELNDDQINTLKKKPEISALIKEFEDLHKQYISIDEEEQKEFEANKKLQDQRIVNEINEKVKNEKELHSLQLQYLFKVSYALNIVINTRKLTFSPSEFISLSYVRSILLRGYGINENNQKTEGEIILEKLYDKSMEECCEGVSYKDVSDLIDLILNPPQVTQKENTQNISFFSQETLNTDFEEKLPPSTQPLVFTTCNEEETIKDAKNEAAVSMSKINFMQSTECGEEEKKTEEIKQEENISQENQKLDDIKIDSIEKEIPSTESTEEDNTGEIELTTEEEKEEETQSSPSKEKKSPKFPSQQHAISKNYSPSQFQKKRGGYYKGGRGRRGHYNYNYEQYNNRYYYYNNNNNNNNDYRNSNKENGNSYKGSNNHGYYPKHNQTFVSYYYNNRVVSS
ncbi:hypothetical protein H8356DRAFT_1025862 [Neocallimastix lanati (nom. inval.)]|nr:hypothetical protein H8356DRAFT_1025862 [Neocallimastix sp. JGI-2020a]